jgi:hypothetical protein
MKDVLKIGKETWISLAVCMPDSDNSNLLLPQIEFVYGIGFAGVTEFEYILKDKIIGDEISLHIKHDKLQQVFGHLLRYIKPLVDKKDNIDLKIKVSDIKKSSKKDIVKTILMTAPRGCGYGCK